MQDLTKILKVGDRVWSIMFGEGVVSVVEAAGNLLFFIEFNIDDVPSGRWFDKYGRCGGVKQPQLYPIDQRPEIPAPIWPEVFEIQGDTYKKGEWVAVSDNRTTWGIGRLSGINDGLPTTDKPNFSPSLTWQHIRKLTSFNK